MENTYAFTLKSDRILDILMTDTFINSTKRDMTKTVDTTKKWRGLWDTGASTSSIDIRVADELGLTPIGRTVIGTANGMVEVNTYIIDITLPNHVTVADVIVTSSDLGKDIDLLIGMDIIRHGDFSITHTDNSTTFSFRVPSVKEIDYVIEKRNNLSHNN